MAKSKGSNGKRGPKTPEGKAKSLANLIPAQPGEVRNPEGRKTAGATLREWGNVLAEKELTEAQLRAIVVNPNAPMMKRAAADRQLRLYMPPLARYESLVTGDKTLQQLEDEGVDTAVVKKLKERQEFNKEGEIVGRTREIELHNLAGEEYDRLCDRTEGKPQQTMNHKGDALPVSITMNVVGPKR